MNTTGKKFGGRKAGTTNKITTELRTRISDFLNDNWQQVENDFQTLEPKDRIILFEKLLQFTVPRLQTINTPDMKAEKTEPRINLIVDGKTFNMKE